MAISKTEEIYRVVVINVASGLRGGGEDKLAKRLEAAGTGQKLKLLEVLTIIERSPGLPANCHRLVAMGKKVINGDDSLLDKLIELSNSINGTGDALPKDLPD